MDLTAYENLIRNSGEPVIRAADIAGPDRTLTLGYSADRLDVHIYLADGQIHMVVFDFNDRVLHHFAEDEYPAYQLRPSKRAFPERTDEQFARLMAQVGTPLTFTKFNNERYEQTKDQPFKAARG